MRLTFVYLAYIEKLETEWSELQQFLEEMGYTNSDGSIDFRVIDEMDQKCQEKSSEMPNFLFFKEDDLSSSEFILLFFFLVFLKPSLFFFFVMS